MGAGWGGARAEARAAAHVSAWGRRGRGGSGTGDTETGTAEQRHGKRGTGTGTARYRHRGTDTGTPAPGHRYRHSDTGTRTPPPEHRYRHSDTGTGTPPPEHRYRHRDTDTGTATPAPGHGSLFWGEWDLSWGWGSYGTGHVLGLGMVPRGLLGLGVVLGEGSHCQVGPAPPPLSQETPDLLPPARQHWGGCGDDTLRCLPFLSDFPRCFSPSLAPPGSPGWVTPLELSAARGSPGGATMEPPARACSCGSPASDSGAEAGGSPRSPPKAERSRKRPGGLERAPPDSPGGKRPRKGEGGDAPPSDGDRLFAQKCRELRGFIRPLAELLEGLRRGRYDRGLSSFQQSVAMDRLQRIIGVLQKPEMG
ncbi:circadian-associated transcriptional repressor [Passer montanus]|uniref:circadian-associated transcriptional repressor n=1 Tax=Passer montanus TaxID=9160 RepID=UPI0019609D26|nr:circadian-associated transcriptional repressor [Passer montanus]